MKYAYLHHFHPLESFLALSQKTINVVSQFMNDNINWSLTIQQLIEI